LYQYLKCHKTIFIFT